MKETPSCDHLEGMTDKSQFCTMLKQKETIWKIAYPNSTSAERLSWVLLRQSEVIVNGFMTFLENKLKELKDATIDDLIEFMNTIAETREKSFSTKVYDFWGMERTKGESTMDFGTRLQVLARRIDSTMWEKLVIHKMLIETDDYTRFLINSSIDETTTLANVLKKILDAEEVTHGRDFKRDDVKKKEFKLSCWFCKESDHKKEECRKWKDAGSPVYNFTTRTWETGQLKICNGDVAAMRDVEIRGKTQRVFLDSGATENWIGLKNARSLGVNLLPSSGVNACMADGSILKAVAMCDCEVDFKNGKGIQVLRFYISPRGKDTIIGWKVLRDNCDLFEERSESVSSKESNLTFEDSEKEEDLEPEGKIDADVLVARGDILEFLGGLRERVKVIEEREAISLELREEMYKDGLKEYLDKEEKLGMISRVYEMPKIVSPIHIVKKKQADEHMINGKVPSEFMRVCVDYSELNQYLAKKEVELAKLEDVIDMVAGSKYLSTMDVSSAYKALPLDEYSKELTCFYTPYGIYVAETLPFGLATAPYLFVSELRNSLKEVKSKNFTFYMDDFLFYGSVDLQIKAIKEVSEVLAKRGWYWNVDKCELLKPQVHYIGYQISGTDWKIPEEKLKKLIGLVPPSNAKELASLRGRLLYFSKLIPEFGSITSVWDGGKFQWGEKEQKAFDTIKQALKKDPKITTIPEGAKVVIVVNNGQKRAITCWNSRKASSTERNYSELDRWTVAVYEMMNQSRLKYRKVLVHCDDMEQSKRIRPSYEDGMMGHPKSKRVCGMLFTLSLMDLEPVKLFEAKKEVEKLSLGMLTCQENGRECGGKEMSEMKPVGHLKLTTMENNVIQEARNDPMYMKMFEGIFEGDYKHLQKHKQSLIGERNVFTMNGKLVVPIAASKRIVAKVHKDYHEGTKNLTNRINESFVICGLTRVVKDVILECRTCQMFKRNGKCETLIWTKAIEARERGHMDFFFYAGKTVFLLVDAYSGYPLARVVKRKSDFPLVLEEVVALFGDFQLLVSDNEPVFQGGEVAEWLEERGTLHLFVPTYSPKSNGLAEGMVNILKTKMKKAQEDFHLGVEEALTWSLISVRTSKDKEGKSRMDKFVGQMSSGNKWFQEIHVEDADIPVFFKISPKHTWTEGQLVWTIGSRIKGVLVDGVMHMLPSERVYARKLSPEEEFKMEQVEKVFQYDSEIADFMKSQKFNYPAGIFFTDGSTKLENGYGVIGLILPEKGKVEIQLQAQRNIKHGASGPSANRLEIMAVKAALEIAKKFNLQQVFVFSDSRNLTGAYSEGWIHNWRDNGFTRLSNSSLYKAVDTLVQELPEVHIKRVLAHKGVVLNECADSAAKGEDLESVSDKVKRWVTSLSKTATDKGIEGEKKDPDDLKL
uniref:RNA-directed DNA polymerase n=1 Tax=Strongyloides papillosus TaxID=174720 RepID=A0A0N5C6B1_STREA